MWKVKRWNNFFLHIKRSKETSYMDLIRPIAQRLSPNKEASRLETSSVKVCTKKWDMTLKSNNSHKRM